MLTLCMFHIKLKRTSRLVIYTGMCACIKITLSVMLCLMKTCIFLEIFCLNPWTVKVYWSYCESSWYLCYKLSLTMKSHIIQNPCFTEFVWLWTSQTERKYEVVCFKNSKEIIRLRADLQMTRMPRVCLSGFS